MISGLARGDRVPDFQRPNAAGTTVMLYDLQVGQPLVLLMIENLQSTDTRTALETLAQDAAWNAITRVITLHASVAQCAALAGTASGDMTLLADDGALAAHLLGTQAAGAPLMTGFALDANLRVIERFEHRSSGQLADFLRQLHAACQQDSTRPAQIIDQQAPVLFVPRVMEPGMCAELTAYFEQQGGQPSGTAYIEGDKAYWRQDPSVKLRRDVYIKDGPWLERIKEVVARRVLPEIQRCFNYRVTQHEVFKLVCYDADTGGYFRPHRDNESRDTQHRRFAMTLHLNTGDYQGGQLRFPEFSPNLYQAARGDATVFASSLLHEVVPVTAGKRYVLLGFFFGDDQTMQPIEYV